MVIIWHDFVGRHLHYQYLLLTHWGRVMHICVSKQAIIGSDNGLSPGRRQAIIWTNDGILLIGTLGTNFSEIVIEIRIFSFKKMGLNVSSAKWRPFCLGLNVLTRGIPLHLNLPMTLRAYYSQFSLTPSGLMASYGRIKMGLHWLQWWLDAWWHQAIAWHNLPSHQ